jgi:ketosteroid isomerase-like protein
VAIDQPAAAGWFRGPAKPTGIEWETPFVHVFDVSGGQIRRWEACFDTAVAASAHRRESD